VLAARRRLLGMLLALAGGSGALAFTGLAAWWVIVPPMFMLLGYLALLREAAKADAERRELAGTHVSAAVPAAAVPAAADTAAATRPSPASRPAPPALPPDAEVIDISASLTPEEEKLYDQYADAKLRAVGDLARPLTRTPPLASCPRPGPGRAPAGPGRGELSNSSLVSITASSG
jgi:hypothetical protein